MKGSMSDIKLKKECISDGIYLSQSHWGGVILTTESGIEVHDAICLEIHMLEVIAKIVERWSKQDD